MELHLCAETLRCVAMGQAAAALAKGEGYVRGRLLAIPIGREDVNTNAKLLALAVLLLAVLVVAAYAAQKQDQAAVSQSREVTIAAATEEAPAPPAAPGMAGGAGRGRMARRGGMGRGMAQPAPGMGPGAGRGGMGMGMGMSGCPMHGMMGGSALAVTEGGVYVLHGDKLTKYDHDLNLVKEVEIAVDWAKMGEKMQQMRESCPVYQEMQRSTQQPAMPRVRARARVRQQPTPAK